MPQITDKQTQVLTAIRRYIAMTGQAPTVREIGAEVGLSSSCSVQKHLEALERLGKIRRSNFKYRSIELVDDHGVGHLPTAQTLMVPLFGKVAGGIPMTAVQDLTPDMLPLPASFVGRGERDQQAMAVSSGEFHEAPYFALEVNGDSMIDDGIADGDLVIAHRQRTARDGDIVIALVDKEEATCKRYFREGNAVRLQPANERFSPLVTADVEVLGRVTLAIKRF